MLDVAVWFPRLPWPPPHGEQRFRLFPHLTGGHIYRNIAINQ